MPKFRIVVCHAQKCLEQIDEWGITKYWTGDAYVWDVSTLDENGRSDSLFYDSEVAAQAYIHALKVAVNAHAAAIQPSQKVIEELERLGCEAFWQRYRGEWNRAP
jgi:hypothetical protein